MDGNWTSFVGEHLSELALRTVQHIVLTGVSTGLAILAGVPLGVLATRVRWMRGPVISAVSILQTIPSLAMLTLLLVLTRQIGAVPAITALTLYALLPIVRNTITGLEGVSTEVMEAARGVGMTHWQQLRMVRLPLALPVIVAGIRTAAVIGVGIATLSAFIGAGGLGQFINRGLALADTRLIVLGAVPAALLALIVDFALGALNWALDPRRKADGKTLRATFFRWGALTLPIILFAAGILGYARVQTDITIGSKNFTEQVLLGEMMAQVIEARTDLNVDRRFCLGGTMICHDALEQGEIDLYPEYTGTGLTAILKQDVIRDPNEALTAVRRAYGKRFDARWMSPFGFNNTYAITVRKSDAKQHGWTTISDLQQQAPNLRAGFTGEFAERLDGYPGLSEKYGFRFGDVRDMDPAIMYSAIANGEVDVICAFMTDGRIAAYDLLTLEDDRQFFPPYYAAPVIRREILESHPQVGTAVNTLADVLDDATMQRLNNEVDEQKRNPAAVAREFLLAQRLLSGL